jgi:hypothetical protein
MEKRGDDNVEFLEIKFKKDVLTQFKLPDIAYPVPAGILGDILGKGGDVGFHQMLYWLQEYSRLGETQWESLQPAMLRLCELLAPEDPRNSVTVQGDNWFVEIGPVDLSGQVVTIQRQDVLVAAIAPRQDMRLRMAVYHHLDARAIRMIIGLGLHPHPESGVCMRPNNWEYALDQSAGMGQAYA